MGRCSCSHLQHPAWLHCLLLIPVAADWHYPQEQDGTGREGRHSFGISTGFGLRIVSTKGASITSSATLLWFGFLVKHRDSLLQCCILPQVPTSRHAAMIVVQGARLHQWGVLLHSLVPRNVVANSLALCTGSMTLYLVSGSRAHHNGGCIGLARGPAVTNHQGSNASPPGMCSWNGVGAFGASSAHCGCIQGLASAEPLPSGGFGGVSRNKATCW